jgi:hypothetical protein
MPRMSDSDAAKLARSLGREGQIARRDVADWQPLLDYCGGNPLTLRVLVGQAIRMGLRGRAAIADFVAAIRSGEQAIEDADAAQGRDRSLGASLDYGFRNAFRADEQPLIALLHLFQGTVFAQVLRQMANLGEHSLPEVQGKTDADFSALLHRAAEVGLLQQTTGLSAILNMSWRQKQGSHRRCFRVHCEGSTRHQRSRETTLLCEYGGRECIGDASRKIQAGENIHTRREERQDNNDQLGLVFGLGGRSSWRYIKASNCCQLEKYR